MATRCSATSKRTGNPCGHWATGGATVCRWHGGAAPQVMAKAERRLLADRARADLERLGVSIETTPVEALEAMLWEAAGNVAMLRGLVAGLPLNTFDAEVVGGVDENAEAHTTAPSSRRRSQPISSGSGIAGRVKADSLEAKPHVFVVLYNEERDRLHRIAKDCAGLGLDERRVRVAEVTTERLFGAVKSAIEAAGLADAQREAFTRALAGGLRAMAPGG